MKEKFKLYALEDFPDSRAAPDWIVHGIIEADSLNLIFGDPESGKSLLAIDMACCVASGTSFHGLPCKRGSVVYIAGEGESGLMRRFDAWAVATNTKVPPSSVFISTEPQSLCSQGSDAIIQSLAKIPPVSLIIIDTLSRNFGEGDENSTTDMNRFIKAVDQIRKVHGSAILILHHPGHGDKHRARGALTLKAALDSEYRTDKTRSTGKVVLTNTKMKDFLPIEPLSLKICQVNLGSEITSAALFDFENLNTITPTTKAGKGKNQRVAMDELRKIMNGGDFASYPQWRAACESTMKGDAFRHVVKSLKAAGLVQVEGEKVRKCH